MKYCEERKISVFKFVPFTIIFKIKEKRKDKENEIKNFEKENQDAKDNLKRFINMSQKFVVDYNDIGNYYDKDFFIKEVERRENLEEKKEKKKKKKKKEDFPFESKNEHSSQSAVNVPLTNNIIPKSNITTSSINIDKSLISQEDLDDLRKDFFEKPITIRRIIYKVIKKKKKIKSMI
jgi:hypothetical protein